MTGLGHKRQSWVWPRSGLPQKRKWCGYGRKCADKKLAGGIGDDLSCPARAHTRPSGHYTHTYRQL